MDNGKLVFESTGEYHSEIKPIDVSSPTNTSKTQSTSKTAKRQAKVPTRKPQAKKPMMKKPANKFEVPRKDTVPGKAVDNIKLAEETTEAPVMKQEESVTPTKVEPVITPLVEETAKGEETTKTMSIPAQEPPKTEEATESTVPETFNQPEPESITMASVGTTVTVLTGESEQLEPKPKQETHEVTITSVGTDSRTDLSQPEPQPEVKPEMQPEPQPIVEPSVKPIVLPTEPEVTTAAEELKAEYTPSKQEAFVQPATAERTFTVVPFETFIAKHMLTEEFLFKWINKCARVIPRLSSYVLCTPTCEGLYLHSIFVTGGLQFEDYIDKACAVLSMDGDITCVSYSVAGKMKDMSNILRLQDRAVVTGRGRGMIRAWYEDSYKRLWEV